MEWVVGISDMKVSNTPSDILVTYSLGSCVGLSLFDPEAQVGGLIHCMLPLSKTDPVRAGANPHMYVDTGVISLLQALTDLGVRNERLVAKVAGGASILDGRRTFRIGERNYAILRKILWMSEIAIAAADVGGTKARTMLLHIGTGRTMIRSAGKEAEL